jgi:hypothetical protein
MSTLDDAAVLQGSRSRACSQSGRCASLPATVPCGEHRPRRDEDEDRERGGDVASKDKGGGKTSKKPAQHDLKAKRKAKKEKRASK